MSNLQSEKLIRCKFYQDPDHFNRDASSKFFDKSIQKSYFDYYNNQNDLRREAPNFQISTWLSKGTGARVAKKFWFSFGIAANEERAQCLAQLMFKDIPYQPVLVLQINHFYDLKTHEDIEPDYHPFFGFHKVVSIQGLLPLEACWTKKLTDIRITQLSDIAHL